MPDIESTAPGIDLEKLLNNLNLAKTSGLDLVPARILKLASKELAPVSSLIYEHSDLRHWPSSTRHAASQRHNCLQKLLQDQTG